MLNIIYSQDEDRAICSYDNMSLFLGAFRLIMAVEAGTEKDNTYFLTY